MAGISHNAKNSNLPEFGDSVSGGSKALCGLTEAAAQVKTILESTVDGHLSKTHKFGEKQRMNIRNRH